jgi:hypothetical protein
MKKARWVAGLVGWSLALSMARAQTPPVRLGLPTDAETGAITAVIAAPKSSVPQVNTLEEAPKVLPLTTPESTPRRFEIVVEQPPRPIASKGTEKRTPNVVLTGVDVEKKAPAKKMPVNPDSKTPPPVLNLEVVQTPAPEEVSETMPETALSNVCAAYGLPRMHVWFAPEYLYWQTRGMRLPPLVTEAAAGGTGALGDPLTALVLGDQRVTDDFRSGLMLRGGVWLNSDATLGIDGSLFWIGQETFDFARASNGVPGLFRPVIGPGGAPVAISTALAPGQAGSINVAAATDFSGADVNLRGNLASTPLVRIDGLIGYRYLRLRDALSIQENIAFAAPPSTLLVTDRFDTTNEFHGAQIGLAGEARRGCWTLGVVAKFAMGNTRRETFIDGDNVQNSGTPAFNRFPGGVLAQTSNMGRYINDDFAVVPEVGITLGVFVTERLRLTAGWNFLYWSQVGRASEQIDRNMSQIPPAAPGAVGPFYLNNNTDFWAHGFRAGFEWQY